MSHVYGMYIFLNKMYLFLNKMYLFFNKMYLFFIWCRMRCDNTDKMWQSVKNRKIMYELWFDIDIKLDVRTP